MAALQGQAPNTDAFDSYFRLADLDRDGRISGAEAVSFFQGFNLPKETLALVWSYSAGGNSSLGRAEFYNALRLVTVAQSGRQLTADIVKAALYGPAAAKIPAPKINSLPATSASQVNQTVAPLAQSGLARPPASQVNFMPGSSPQANNILPQPALTGFMRPPIYQKSAAPLPQSSQSGFMRPPASQMKSMATSPLQENNMLQQPPQAGFARTPQMNSTATSAPQDNNMLPQPAQAGFMRPPASQHTGLSGQQMPITADLNLLGSSSPQNNFMRPPQAPQVSGSHPVQGFSQGFHAANTVVNPGLSSSSSSALSTDWLGGRSSGLPGAAATQFPNHDPFLEKDGFGMAHSTQEAASKPQIQHAISSPSPSKHLDPVSTSFQTTFMDSNSSAVSGNGFSSSSMFGGDAFLAAQTKQDASTTISSPNNFSNLSKMAPVAPKNSVIPGQPANQQVMPGLPPAANQMQRNQPYVKQNQLDTMHKTSAFTISNVQVGPDSSVSTQNEVPWPKITQPDIRKYTKVFHEVDKDRDGKITGPEARNLFLSWRLPREVLRQVWDLSDQDNDSMLSLKEFCVALYLMERFREGRSLPSVLPNSVKFDQTLILLTGQLSSAHGASAWQQRPVSSQQPIPESLLVGPPTRAEPSRRISIPSQPDAVLPAQQKPRVPVLEQNLVNQLSEEEQKTLNLKLEEATDADKKVQELEKEILDCKEKTENYRKQMQELVLYKSRCDSRLNETIERTSADKREVELLASKYEEIYKQKGDVASKLTADQATFRDIQERKVELYNSIVKMEQGEKSDGVHQEHADKIQTDLDDLVKALNERCKEFGLRAKPTLLEELPFGWQPSIQEGTADWDETWDKFDKDDGFTIIKELTLEVENVVPLEKVKPASVTSVKVTELATSEPSEEATKVEEPATKIEGNTDKSLSMGEPLTETESSNVLGEENLARTPPGSPGRSATESPSRESQSTFSPHAHTKEHHSEYDDPESTIFREKFTDEVAWGATFDSDDTDSIWGFNPIKTKDAVRDVKRLDSFSGPGDFGMNSFGTDSPSAASVFGKERSPFFDSVPGTPNFNSGFSPKFNQGTEDHSFDSFSRFDSFSTHDSIFPPSGTLTRFDSMSSSIDPSQNAFYRFDSFGGTDPSQNALSRFDSFGGTDPSRNAFSRFDSFGSTDPSQNAFSRFDSFGGTDPPRNAFSRFDSFSSSTADTQREFSRFDSMRSTAEPHETLARFDSIKSSTDYNHGFSFDDSDPFGSGPFKTSETHAPKKGADQWSAF